MRIIFTFCLSFILFDFSAQTLKEVFIYEDSLYHKRIAAEEEIPGIDSLKVLIVDFQNGSTGKLKQTLLNNPQLIEMHLLNTPAEALKIVLETRLNVLEYLIVEDYDGEVLEIRSIQAPMLFSLSVDSERTKTVYLESGVLNSLQILSIQMPELTSWKSAVTMPDLQLIDLEAPKLEEFPFIDCPEMYQFSMRCSLNEFPAGFCGFTKLHLASFHNYKVISIPECISKRVRKNCYYSNISIYDGVEGKLVKEVLSKDR